MSPLELRASLSLAAIFGLRLFGMFVILPVFALYADGRPGWNLTLVGVALGAYGLTQAILQIPVGWLSDRIGRKPILYAGLLVMAAGSFIAAAFETPAMIILGRMLQGAGAISAVAIALAGDLTRPSQRTKAMALIGSSIGAAFAVSFVAAPFLATQIGVPGIFAMTGILCVVSMGVVAWVVPDVPERIVVPDRQGFREVMADPALARINVGIFALRFVLMALFVVIPGALVQAGLAAPDHWALYLGVVGAGFVLMLPVVLGMFGRRERNIVMGAIVTLAAAVAALGAGISSLPGIAASLVIFFGAFNVLEAKLPALVSRLAPEGSRGMATGVFSSVQFLGMFAGGAAGGMLAQAGGALAVVVACLVVMAIWFAASWKMGEPAQSPEEDAASLDVAKAPAPRT